VSEWGVGARDPSRQLFGPVRRGGPSARRRRFLPEILSDPMNFSRLIRGTRGLFAGLRRLDAFCVRGGRGRGVGLIR
jgi:hypothetical protein